MLYIFEQTVGLNHKKRAMLKFIIEVLGVHEEVLPSPVLIQNGSFIQYFLH